MAGFGDFLGRAGAAGEQLFVWQVLGQLVSILTLPFQQALTQAMLELDPNTPLSPQEAAALVARGLMDESAGREWAKKSGIDSGPFASLVKAARSGPDVGALVEAYQRGFIGRGSDDGEQLSLFGGFTETGIRPEWHPILEKLTVQIPTVAEVMNAWLEGQITEAEAHKRYLEAGGDPTWFQTSYNAQGEAPTPTQGLELVNRGIIGWDGQGPGSTSFHQLFLEGPWRNKWEKAFRALAEHVTLPRSVTAMFHAGQLTHDEAAAELKKSGLSPTMIAAYLAPAKHATVTEERHLAKGDILSLYGDKLMSRAAALKGLEALKYPKADAEHLLDLTDFKTAAATVRASMTRVRTLYQGGKIDKAGALAALDELKVPHAEARQLVDLWDITRQHNPKELTAAQVASAVYLDLISQTEGMARLVAMGYDQADAWLVLADRLKGPPKDIPRPAELGPAPVVTGGA